MFSSFFSRSHGQGVSDSHTAPTMPAGLAAMRSAPDSAVAPSPTHDMAGQHIQQLLSQALQSLGIDLQTLPADWRQRVSIELLRQVRGSHASFQIDPSALKALLTQLAQQPGAPVFPAAKPSLPMPAAAPAAQASAPTRRPHVDIFQL